MEAILLTLLGAIIGAISSLAITHLYYVKGRGLETISNNMWESLRNIMIQQTYSNFFTDEAITFKEKDKFEIKEGVPHIEELRILKEGERCKGLLKIVDTGWDLPYDATTLKVNGDKKSLTHIGFGYKLFDFHLEGKEASYELEFNLRDLKKQEKQQVFKI